MASDVPPRTLGAAHAPLRDQVRDDIRQRIVEGLLTPGQKIVERELAAELGVSRLPIREAIRMLETEGFVTVVPRSGVVVRRLSRRDVEELFDVREALEVFAVRRATERATDHELKRLTHLVDQAAKPRTTREPKKAEAARDAFHDEIIRLAHIHLLAELLEPLQGRLHWLFRQNQDHRGLCQEHHRLVEAMSTRDPARAGEEALRHVRRNREVSLDLLYPDEPTEESVKGHRFPPRAVAR